MRYCPNCGEEISEGVRFCPRCGHNLAGNGAGGSVSGDAPSTGYAVLCFFFPLIGLILFLVWNNDYPQRAKSCGKGALIGVITQVVLGVCAGVVSALYGGSYFY